jgi:hypothetical protein
MTDHDGEPRGRVPGTATCPEHAITVIEVQAGRVC